MVQDESDSSEDERSVLEREMQRELGEEEAEDRRALEATGFSSWAAFREAKLEDDLESARQVLDSAPLATSIMAAEFVPTAAESQVAEASAVDDGERATKAIEAMQISEALTASAYDRSPGAVVAPAGGGTQTLIDPNKPGEDALNR